MGRFLPAHLVSRPNRFTALVELPDGSLARAHVADPGRLRELLFEGNQVLLAPKEGGRFPFRLVAARSGGGWVFIDSRIHNDLAQLVLAYMPYLSAFRSLKREVRLEEHRIDFKLDGYWLEVKGCTLVRDGIAYFPDAPTRRGLEHVKLLKAQPSAGVLFLVMADAELMALNFATDPAFSKELASSHLDLFAFSFKFDGEALEPLGLLPTTREEDARSVLPFLYELERAVETYNQYHEPEARYDVVEVNSDSFVLALTGYVAISCCLFDYMDDIIYEAGLSEWTVSAWKENKGQFLIRYARKGEEPDIPRGWVSARGRDMCPLPRK